MRKILFTALVAALTLVSCKKERDPFLISQGQIGNLTTDVVVKELDSVFALDSVVKIEIDDDQFVKGGDVEIFDKAGSLLMILTPHEPKADTNKIKTIRVVDPRYKTEKGLGVDATYQVIKDNYTVTDIYSTLSSVVVNLAETEVYVVIDKDQLPESLRYTSNKIEATQIPPTAKFKFMMMSWEGKNSEDNTEE